MKKWASEKDRQENKRLKYLYGITLEERDKMRIAQEFRCAWCNRHEEEVGILHVDHCHETKVVRRMLCPNCNKVEGLLKHSPWMIEAIEKAVENR